VACSQIDSGCAHAFVLVLVRRRWMLLVGAQNLQTRVYISACGALLIVEFEMSISKEYLCTSDLYPRVVWRACKSILVVLICVYLSLCR
jgi:hypothetical protein